MKSRDFFKAYRDNRSILLVCILAYRISKEPACCEGPFVFTFYNFSTKKNKIICHELVPQEGIKLYTYKPCGGTSFSEEVH